jgi:electron transport complex protein RnfC
MKIFSFKGGIHPPAHKKTTADIPIVEMPVPQELIIPVIQHTGAPCQVLVKKGDKVLKGQKIGDNNALISAPIQASTSGEVSEVKLALHPLGSKVLSIFIKPDQKDTWIQPMITSTIEDTRKTFTAFR